MARRVSLNSRGVAEFLRSPALDAVVTAAANQTAENVRDMNIGVGDKDGGKREKPIPVKVEPGVSDRVRASVTLAHPAGQAVQAKHGALTKAATQAGLSIGRKKRGGK